MIGTVAGDIIGSPYVNNPRKDSSDIFFPLFVSSEKVEIHGLDARMRTYQAKAGEISRDVAAVLAWMLRGDRTKEGWQDVAAERGVGPRVPMGSVLAACVPVVRLSDGLDDALRNVSVLVSAARGAERRADDMKAAMDYARFASCVLSAGNMQDALAESSKVLGEAGYDLSRNTSVLSPFLQGTAVQLSPGRLAPGDGKAVREPSLVIPAVWAALNESRSWEEAVRRGVALGGDSALTGALAGGMAELRWEVPEAVVLQAKDHLSREDKDLVASYERVVKAGEDKGREARLGAEEGRFSVIRLEGAGPVYVIPEDRPDMEEAVRRLNAERGMSAKKGDYTVIRPDALADELERLSLQRDARGVALDGTYVEHARPEVRHLWLQDGRVRSAATRSGEAMDGGKLPAVSTRQKTRNDFEALKAHASGVRGTLERKAGWDPGAGVGLPGFDAFLTEKLMERGDYAKAVRDLEEVSFRLASGEDTGVPGWDSRKEEFVPLDRDAYLRYRVSQDWGGEDYHDVVSRRYEAMMNRNDGQMHIEREKAMGAVVAKLEAEVAAMPDSVAKAARVRDLQSMKDDLARFKAFKYDMDAFREEMCPKVFGKTYAELQASTRAEAEAETLKPFLQDADEAYDTYRKVADALVAEYRAAADAVSGYVRDNVSGKAMESYEKQYSERNASLVGSHLHFKSAMYPVVMTDSIEIRQGDTLRARVLVDDDGRFQVDGNAKTGGVHVEGIDGVLATMNIIRDLVITDENGRRRVADASVKMDRFREALDAFCLDEGRIEDEEERLALEEDDAGKVYDEARAVRKKYGSNVERAVGDMGLELAVAVAPAAPVLSVKAAEAREERRSESEERYAGLDRQGAVDSKAHQGSVFTVGHSNMKAEEFDALMKRHGIQVLVDIRSYTSSKYNPQFNKPVLDKRMAGMDVEYHHFPEFGGKQFVGEGDAKRQLSYEEIMKTDAFKKGMKDLRDCVKDGYRVALMCSEQDPMDCHRMVMMGRALAHPEVYGSKAKPMDVQHITRQGYTLSQEHFERKLMETYGLSENPDAARRGVASVAVAPPVNISSRGEGLAAELTNVGNVFPITFRGKDFVNTEHAYQTWKTGAFDPDGYAAEGRKVDKPVGGDNFGLMREIIAEKLMEYPQLTEDITRNGGARWLLSCRHDVTGDRFWESAGSDGFIKALANAYMDVTSSDARRLDIGDSLAEYRREPAKGAGLAEDPTYGKRLAEAYRRRGEVLVEGKGNKEGKGISLKRNMMVRKAAAEVERDRSRKNGYRRK